MLCRLLILLLSVMSFSHTEPRHRVIINENYGTEMSQEQLDRADRAKLIKSIDIDGDTLRVSFRGPKLTIPDLSDYKRSYSADLIINGEKTLFRKKEIPSFTPKSSQYNLTDSCFYLSFDLSPRFQTKGVKMHISVFLFSDSVPSKGQRYQISAPSFDENNPIIGWTKEMGNMAVIQVGYFDEAEKIFDKSIVSDSIWDKRLVLSTMEFSGSVEVISVRRSKSHNQLGMEMKIIAEATLSSNYFDNIRVPLDIDGRVRLYQIEKADILPCYFEMEFCWPDYLIPVDAFDV